MVGSPNPHIIDAGVWIDLERGRVIKELFLLHHGWATSDLVIGELKALGSLLIGQGLRVFELQPEEIMEIERLRQIYKGPSIADLSCLVLAKSQKGTLVAGDQALRNAGKSESVRVKGTLWILDEWVDYQIFTGEQAAYALQEMIKNRGWFPKDEVTKRIKRWTGKS